MEFIITAFAMLLILALYKWFTKYVALLSLIYYLEKKGYKPPTDQENSECTQYVLKHIFKGSNQTGI